MSGPTLEALVVRLAGSPQLRSAELAAIDKAQWPVLDARAAEHRLQPWLHSRWHGHRAVPAGVSRVWAEAYRASALDALLQRAVLLRTVRLLASRDIETLALKGAWLAWHAYRQPAQRPMRDLDLLLRQDKLLDARSLLMGEGFTETGTDGLPAETWARRFKHLPPLVSPEGVVVELHRALWDDDPRLPAPPAGLFERAIPDGEEPALRYPGPVDMLMHLAVHAAAHRYDGGPLMLLDFECLLATQGFDWPQVLARARAEGWERPLALALHGMSRWASQGLERSLPEDLHAPEHLVARLPALLAKPSAARDEDIAFAKAARRDIGALEKVRRVLARRERFGSTRDWLGWIGGELRATRVAGHRPARSQTIAELDRWLVG